MTSAIPQATMMTMVTGKNTQLKIRQTTGLRLMKRPNNIMPEGMPPSCTPPQQRIEKGIRQRNAIQYSNESEDEHAAKHKNADDNDSSSFVFWSSWLNPPSRMHSGGRAHPG